MAPGIYLRENLTSVPSRGSTPALPAFTEPAIRTPALSSRLERPVSGAHRVVDQTGYCTNPVGDARLIFQGFGPMFLHRIADALADLFGAKNPGIGQ